MHDYCQFDLDIKLMKAVRKHVVLYDTSVPQSMDFNAREVAWHQIGDELSRPASECKTRWGAIRDIYRRSLRKNGNPYKYKQYLTFLNPFLKIAGLDTSNTDVDAPFDQNQEDEKDDYKNEDNSLESNDQTDIDTEDKKPLIKKIQLKRKLSRNHSRKRNRKAAVDTPEPEFADADPLEDDSTDVFLKTIGATLKTFTPYHLNVAKSKIFAIVQEHELQQIMSSQGTSGDALGDTDDL